jgi:hypothetical protein
MNKTNTLLIVILNFVIVSCSPKLPPKNYSATVEFIYKEASGTIAVKSSGYGKKQELAVGDALKNAFSVILFKGLPGTELNIPLIENENEAKSNHNDYFKNFFEQGEYNKFLMSSSFITAPSKNKGVVIVSLEIKINYNSLRKDLEQNHIIRKFGF